MATTLRIESFAPENIRERTERLEPAAAGDSLLKLVGTTDYATGDILYVGSLSREGCERAVVASVGTPTQLTLHSDAGTSSRPNPSGTGPLVAAAT